jgi:hypothetical protein
VPFSHSPHRFSDADDPDGPKQTAGSSLPLILPICGDHNNVDKAFQYWMEATLIEVMMLLIQFVSIVNLIQMKLMKLDNVKDMINQRFQHDLEFELSMILKNYKSICEKQHQSKDHSS